VLLVLGSLLGFDEREGGGGGAFSDAADVERKLMLVDGGEGGRERSEGALIWGGESLWRFVAGRNGLGEEEGKEAKAGLGLGAVGVGRELTGD
jgi:hypothetical protein